MFVKLIPKVSFTRALLLCIYLILTYKQSSVNKQKRDWESVVDSVIQATGMVDREPRKGSKWPAESLHHTWGSTRGDAHNWVPPGVD